MKFKPFTPNQSKSNHLVSNQTKLNKMAFSLSQTKLNAIKVRPDQTKLNQTKGNLDHLLLNQTKCHLVWARPN